MWTDKSILVPLTNSLYVPGKLADTENVIVDVGTGYYVKKVRLIFYFFNSLCVWFLTVGTSIWMVVETMGWWVALLFFGLDPAASAAVLHGQVDVLAVEFGLVGGDDHEEAGGDGFGGGYREE
jgi:hypothetical protein